LVVVKSSVQLAFFGDSPQLFLLWYEVVSVMPRPQLGGPRCLFVWNLTVDLSGLGDPASSYATTGLALGFIGTRKPHHLDKVETSLVGILRAGLHISVDIRLKWVKVKSSCRLCLK
jgi:hypothetical protein